LNIENLNVILEIVSIPILIK